MQFKKNDTVVAISILALTACGGGGSSTTTPSIAPAPSDMPVAPVVPVAPADQSPIPAPTPAPVITPSAEGGSLQTSVPAATYASASQELAFFSTLNEFRGKLGLGLLAQSAKLDKSSANHLNYIVGNPDVNTLALDANGTPVFHSEDTVRPGYTGVTPTDRAKVALYGAAYVSEEGGFGAAGAALTKLIATVYHRNGLMQQGVRDIGMAFGGAGAQTFVVSTGFEVTRQFNSAAYFGSYPADKQTGVPLTMAIESPNPFADVGYANYATKTSFPINVVSEASTTLAVTSFTVTEDGAAAPLSVYQLNASTSAQDKRYLGANAAYIVAKAPFKPHTKYTVLFDGKVNGVAMSKVWSFSIGG